jgi:hypothetical protein
VDELQARLDRLESLVGVAYNDDGVILPALHNAIAQTEIEQMRHEVQAVVNFLRENRP